MLPCSEPGVLTTERKSVSLNITVTIITFVFKASASRREVVLSRCCAHDLAASWYGADTLLGRAAPLAVDAKRIKSIDSKKQKNKKNKATVRTNDGGVVV